jgi:hypothetical protein
MLTVGGVVGQVKPGTHGNCAKAEAGIQARLKIANRAALERFTIFSMGSPLRVRKANRSFPVEY